MLIAAKMVIVDYDGDYRQNNPAVAECRDKVSMRFRELCTQDLVNTDPWDLACQALREAEAHAVPCTANRNHD